MASSAPSLGLGLETRIEDVLSYLPISRTTEYRKGQMIYGPDKLSQRLYLVVAGTVGIAQMAEDGSEVLLELVRLDELFGESAFLGVSRPSELAVAVEKATLMSWAIADMEALITKRPRLAVALLQMLAQRAAQFSRRIQSLSLDTTEQRLARSLIHFSERLGSPQKDGSVRMMPLTHVLLSRYLGTSREVVTQYMNRFRKERWLSYSRRGIALYPDSLRMFLASGGAPQKETGSGGSVPLAASVPAMVSVREAIAGTEFES